MNTEKTGGPAFPVPEHLDERGHGHEQHIGMTLRDWFAGMALQGFIAASGQDGLPVLWIVASDAYDMADAMLHAREAS